MQGYSEGFFAALVGMLPDPVLVFDLAGRIEYVNGAASRLTGYSGEELQSLTIDDVVPGCLLLGVTAPNTSRHEEGPVARSLDGWHRDGARLQLSARLESVVHEGARRFVVTLHDEGGKRRVEAALRLGREKANAVGAHIESITNDFNNVLGTILANLALVQEDLGLDHLGSPKLEHIRSSTGRAANLVQLIVSEVAMLAGSESKASWSGRLARSRHRQVAMRFKRPEPSGTSASGQAEVAPDSPFAPRSTGSQPLLIASAEEGPRAPKRVLLVDDEEALLLAGARILERNGYVVTACPHPQTAVDLLERDPGAFDLVVADYSMPGVSGLQLAAEAKTLRQTLPILLVSGRITEDVRVEAASVGVWQILPKPFAAPTLLEVVDRMLRVEGSDGEQPGSADRATTPQLRLVID